jgi:hypothetical protein
MFPTLPQGLYVHGRCLRVVEGRPLVAHTAETSRLPYSLDSSLTDRDEIRKHWNDLGHL